MDGLTKEQQGKEAEEVIKSISKLLDTILDLHNVVSEIRENQVRQELRLQNLEYVIEKMLPK